MWHRGARYHPGCLRPSREGPARARQLAVRWQRCASWGAGIQSEHPLPDAHWGGCRQGRCRVGQAVNLTVSAAGSHFLSCPARSFESWGLGGSQSDLPGTQGSQQVALGPKLLTSGGSCA